MIDRSPLIRRATADDEPFLWTMLYYAAHMDELGVEMSAIRDTPALAKYVAGWFQVVPGREFVNRVGGVSLVMERPF